jgi:hypothetical protein
MAHRHGNTQAKMTGNEVMNWQIVAGMKCCIKLIIITGHSNMTTCAIIKWHARSCCTKRAQQASCVLVLSIHQHWDGCLCCFIKLQHIGAFAFAIAAFVAGTIFNIHANTKGVFITRLQTKIRIPRFEKTGWCKGLQRLCTDQQEP